MSLSTPFSWIAIHSALACLDLLGYAWEKALPFLSHYQGVGYRFERLYQHQDTVIYRDYGHHPKELRNVWQTLTSFYPSQEKVIIFQPHKYSRTKMFFEDFVSVLKEYDKIFLLPTYSAGESCHQGYDIDKLASCLTQSSVLSSSSQFSDVLRSLSPSAVLMFQGAGEIMEMAHRYVNDLEQDLCLQRHQLKKEAVW
jgi:UDP-N-acetylmuramate--alanine ligase